MEKSKTLLVSVLIGLSVGLSTPAFAGKANGWSLGNAGFGNGSFGNGGFGSPNNRMSLTQLASGLVPLVQVLETINAQEPGSQLDTNTVTENGRTIYIVRWQAARGRIIIFRVDAESGRIIGRQG